MIVDLDKFKPINDTYGHDAGDFVLKTAAQRLLACTRCIDSVARLGGDEFALVLDYLHNPGEAEDLAHRIVTEIEKPIEYEGASLQASCSIGICFCKDIDNLLVKDILKLADAAMYKAKASPKKSYFLEKLN